MNIERQKKGGQSMQYIILFKQLGLQKQKENISTLESHTSFKIKIKKNK